MVLVYILLLYILCVHNNRLSKIRGLPEFPNYFVLYLRGGMRAAVSYTGGGGNINSPIIRYYIRGL